MQLPTGKITSVPVTRLTLDLEHPRLIKSGEEATEKEIITQLYLSTDISELLSSISTNGYLNIEPLIVMEDLESEKLIVLEGNRRLLAIRLLREPELFSNISGLENVENRVPGVPEHHLDSLEEISVFPVKNRTDARPFLGFKHINGPVKWHAYAKARFAADWYREIKHGKEGTLESIALAIGDRHDTVRRMVHAIYVLDQAVENVKFNVDDHYSPKFNFSHFYTALGRIGYMNYLGLDTTWIKFDPSPNPIPDEKLDNLGKVLIWLYGSKSKNIKPVIESQNPDIKRLGEILDHPDARAFMEEHNELHRAHTYTESAPSRLALSLHQAQDVISTASEALKTTDDPDKSLQNVADSIKDATHDLSEQIRMKYER